MEYIRLLGFKLFSGKSGSYSMPQETKIVIFFVAMVVILVVMMFKSRNKS